MTRLLALGIILFAAAALAQHQIVGGRVLDNNLQVGSAGYNYTARRPGTGLGVPAYRASAAAVRTGRTRAAGMAQTTYWADYSAPTSRYGYQQPRSTGITRASPTGAVYNPLEKPLYRPAQSALVQRGTGYSSIHSAGYSPLR